jgi:hypothetical protein
VNTNALIKAMNLLDANEHAWFYYGAPGDQYNAVISRAWHPQTLAQCWMISYRKGDMPPFDAEYGSLEMVASRGLSLQPDISQWKW